MALAAREAIAVEAGVVMMVGVVVVVVVVLVTLFAAGLEQSNVLLQSRATDCCCMPYLLSELRAVRWYVAVVLCLVVATTPESISTKKNIGSSRGGVATRERARERERERERESETHTHTD